jgi:hypothetical protein
MSWWGVKLTEKILTCDIKGFIITAPYEHICEYDKLLSYKICIFLIQNLANKLIYCMSVYTHNSYANENKLGQQLVFRKHFNVSLIKV